MWETSKVNIQQKAQLLAEHCTTKKFKCATRVENIYHEHRLESTWNFFSIDII